MGYRNLADERQRALTFYVNAETAPTDDEIATLIGVDRSTVITWRKKDEWEKKRQENSITPVELAALVKKEIVQCIEDIKTARKESGMVGPEYVKRLDAYSKVLVRIDGQFDRKGSMLQWSHDFIQYLTETKEKEMLQLMNRILPGYYRSIESK